MDRGDPKMLVPKAIPADPEARFRLLSRTADASRVLAMVAEYASAARLDDVEDFSVSCLPSTSAGERDLVRATTVSVGIVETMVIAVNRNDGGLAWWTASVPIDVDTASWPQVDVEVVDSPLGGGCWFIASRDVEAWETLIGHPDVRSALAARVGRLRSRKPRPSRRNDWHNPHLWAAASPHDPFTETGALTTDDDSSDLDVTAEDRVVLAKVRAAQDRFRALLFQYDEPRCAVCGLDEIAVLDAAHLVPHAAGGRASIENGRILCANHHRALDRDLLRWNATNDRFDWIGDARF